MSDQLKDTILDFIKDVKDNVLTQKDEQADMMLVDFFFSRLHPEMVQQHVVKALLPHKDKVKNRDEKFFLQNKFLFSGLPQDRLNYYMTKIRGDFLSKEDRDTIYEYLDLIIALAEKKKKVI